MPAYQPPYNVTPKILGCIEQIGEMLGKWSVVSDGPNTPHLRRNRRIQTIQASLEIENNTLDLDKVTAILEGKRVLGTEREILEVKGAYAAYDKLDGWMPHDAKHLLDAHQVMMSDIIKSAGSYRKKGVGIHKGKEVVHVAPPADRVPELMDDLLDWLKATDEHPLVSSCIFHYELEFIHPFMDGNGRMGRLWQTLILSRWRPVMAWLAVETVIRDRQQEYYDALGVSDKQGTATNFVEFMLEAILQAMEQVVTESRPESQPESRPESELANKVLDLLLKLGPMGKSELAKGLGHASVSGELKKQVKLLMEGDWIEFTVPEKPNSRMQKYRVVGR